jgi:hypothetical protein
MPLQAPVILTSPYLPFRLRTPKLTDAKDVLDLFANPANNKYDVSLQGVDWSIDLLRRLMERWGSLNVPLDRVTLIAVEVKKGDGGEEEEAFLGMGGMGWIGTGKSNAFSHVMSNTRLRGSISYH